MSHTIFQLTVVVEDDPTDVSWGEGELVKQLRLAAHAVASGTAPVPGGPTVTLTGGSAGDTVTVLLSAVDLP